MWVVWVGVVGELQCHFAEAPFNMDFMCIALDSWVRNYLNFHFAGLTVKANVAATFISLGNSLVASSAFP